MILLCLYIFFGFKFNRIKVNILVFTFVACWQILGLPKAYLYLHLLLYSAEIASYYFIGYLLKIQSAFPPSINTLYGRFTT